MIAGRIFAMSAEQARERIARQLREAVERLHDDIDRVEFWADALDRLTQPVPDYEPNKELATRLLPRRQGSSKRGRDSADGSREH
jgi:hypothetical protein